MGEDYVAGMLPWAELMALGDLVGEEDLQRIQYEQQFDWAINIQ
jgi:hypothetical protein